MQQGQNSVEGAVSRRDVQNCICQSESPFDCKKEQGFHDLKLCVVLCWCSHVWLCPLCIHLIYSTKVLAKKLH